MRRVLRDAAFAVGGAAGGVLFSSWFLELGVGNAPLAPGKESSARRHGGPLIARAAPSPAPAPPVESPAEAERASRILLDGGPSLTHRRVSDTFVSEYDGVTRNPRWTVEVLSRDGVAGDADASPSPSVSRAGVSFREDASIPLSHRARLSAFASSGYDRGHLVPAADARAAGARALADSFLLSNVSPQRGALNREWWAALEGWVRGVSADWARVHVVTGPAFLPRRDGGGGGWAYGHGALGEAGAWVSVPTHFFKVVLAVDAARGRAAVAAFLVPHDSPPAAGAPLADYAVPLAALEAATGLYFFRGVVAPGAVARAEAAAGAPPLRRNAQTLLGGPLAPGLLPPPAAAGTPVSPPPGDTASPSPQAAAVHISSLYHLCAEGACAAPPASARRHSHAAALPLAARGEQAAGRKSQKYASTAST